MYKLQKIIQKDIVYVILAGIGIGLSLSYILLWPVGIVSFSFFLYILHTVHTPKRALILGWVFGFVISGSSLLWAFHALPLTKIGIANPLLSIFIIGMVGTLDVLVMGFATALFAKTYISLRNTSWLDIPLIGFLWVLSEILRAFFFFLITLAPQSLVGTHWTFGFSGYILAGSPQILQLASLGGVYLLGFIFAASGALLLYVRHSRTILMVAIVGMFVLYIPVRHIPPQSPTLSIATLKTTEATLFSTNETIQKHLRQKITNLIHSVISKYPDVSIIVVPEDSRYTSLSSARELSALPIHDDSTIIDSSRIDQQGKPALSRITTYSRHEGFNMQYTKLLLVPEGEYISLLYQGLFMTNGFSGVIKRFHTLKEYGRGKTPTVTMVNTIPIAASLCSEIYSPTLQRKLSEKADVIISVSSHGSVYGSPLLYRHIVAISKVRAVENNRYLIQAINYNNSFILSNKGTLIAVTNSSKPYDFAVASVPLITTRTLFSKFPYTIPFVSMLFIVYIYLKKKKLLK